MKLFENSVGRPSNETISKRRRFKLVITLIAIALITVVGSFVYKSFNGGGVIDANQLAVTPLSNRFTVADNGSYCYTVYAPTNAQNWRVQVYYKKTKGGVYGSNKMIQHNHYNDGKKDQKICLSKQKNNQETYRILVKWTKGANDKAYTTVKLKDWKPAGWSHNALTGWGYKDVTVDWNKITSNNNNNNNNNNPTVSNSITYSVSGTNGSIIVNGTLYDKGKSVSQSTVGNNFVFGNDNGKTNVSVKVSVPSALANQKNHYFQVISYDKNGKQVASSGMSKITSTSVSQTITLTQTVKSIKAIVYGPSAIAGKAGNAIKVFTINASVKPTVTMTGTGEKVSGSDIQVFDSYAKYKMTGKISNPNNITLYARWVTYLSDSINNNNIAHVDKKCIKITKNYSDNTRTLQLDASHPTRAAALEVYSSENACKNRQGKVNAATIKYGMKHVYTTSDGFIQLSAVKGNSQNNIVKSMRQQKKGYCYENALAYGSMILRNTTSFPVIQDDKKYGADIDTKGKTSSPAKVIEVIISQINKGIPVSIHTLLTNRDGSTTEHWVLVVGYQKDATKDSLKNNITTKLKVIDPNGLPNGKVGVATISNQKAPNQKFYRDYRYITWSSASKAKA